MGQTDGHPSEVVATNGRLGRPTRCVRGRWPSTGPGLYHRDVRSERDAPREGPHVDGGPHHAPAHRRRRPPEEDASMRRERVGGHAPRHGHRPRVPRVRPSREAPSGGVRSTLPRAPVGRSARDLNARYVFATARAWPWAPSTPTGRPPSTVRLSARPGASPTTCRERACGSPEGGCGPRRPPRTWRSA
jgi:hypothetical protein